MGRYAIVKGGVVLNVVEADADFAASIAGQHQAVAIESSAASPGDLHADGVFVRPEAGGPPPDEVARWKAHYVLIVRGWMPAVKAAIAAIEDEAERALAECLFWERPTIRRIGDLTQRLQLAAGISDAERDEMFAQADTL